MLSEKNSAVRSELRQTTVNWRYPMHAKDLVGIWIIESFHMEDCATGKRTQPWGERPSGAVTFNPEGRMFALITPDGRSDPKTEADEAVAFRSMLAYSGQYRVEPPNRLVTTVDIAWFEPWVGSEQVRYCNLSGDSLTLTSAPLNMPQQNALMFAVVTWRREVASQCD
ncbi:hypothetical protein GFM18_17805 [Rhizobium laguerreae]|nr:hypothetical protein [Rhizobium laguerreae]